VVKTGAARIKWTRAPVAAGKTKVTAVVIANFKKDMPAKMQAYPF
jgi:hypothetical protein